MSTQKRLSNLTIAVATLLAASIPCFAQTESAKSRTESATTLTAQALAMNERKAATFGIYNSMVSSTSDNVAIANNSSFSSAKFIDGVSKSLANTSLSLAPTTTYELRVDSKEQFRADEFNTPVTTKQISFVPSRGPKFPW